MSEEIIKIQAEGDYHKYYIEIPNMVDDLHLSVYAFRLYAHLKRITWESGTCWKNARHLAEQCDMSVGSVANAKEELEKNHLIYTHLEAGAHGEFAGHVITLVNIWKQNYEKYFTASPDHQVIRTDHEVIRTCSPGDPINNKENNHQKKNRRERGRSAPPPAVDFSSLSVQEAGRIPEIQVFLAATGRFPGRPTYELVVREIREHGHKAEDLKVYYEAWCARGFRPQNLAWLTDWAASGSIPAGRGKESPPDAPRSAQPTREEMAKSLGLA